MIPGRTASLALVVRFGPVTRRVNPTLSPARDDRKGNAVREIRRMSQRGPIREPPRDDRNIDRSEASSDAEAGELSFDDLPFAGPARPDEVPFVHKLQERAENSADRNVETIKRWSPRVQVLCIMGASALLWAGILAPFLLF